MDKATEQKISFKNAEEFSSVNKKDNIQIQDEFCQIHTIKKDLSSGGQGMVFCTNDPELLIKLSFNNKVEQSFVTEPSHIQEINEKFWRIGLLPIPQNLNLAIPLATTKGVAGYIMKIAADMEELGEHFFQKTTDHKKELKKQLDSLTLPTWLKKIFRDEHKKKAGKGRYFSLDVFFYLESGGTRRRLEALSQCVSILARLHSAGLVYVDLSPGNVFISKSHAFNHVWMIDADNLRFEGQKGNICFTPDYGAPEIIMGYQPSQLSDIHAFAVMAYTQ